MITVSAIANATQGQLLCITYEIFLHSIAEALKETGEKREDHIAKAINVIKTLTQDLNFEQPIAHELLRIYIYAQGILLEYKVSDEKLEHVYQVINMIYQGFYKWKRWVNNHFLV